MNYGRNYLAGSPSKFTFFAQRRHPQNQKRRNEINKMCAERRTNFQTCHMQNMREMRNLNKFWRNPTRMPSFFTNVHVQIKIKLKHFMATSAYFATVEKIDRVCEQMATKQDSQALTPVFIISQPLCARRLINSARSSFA